MRVKPAPGRLARDPRSKLPVPEGGADVPESSYWTRRLASGDVVRVDEAAPAAPITDRMVTSARREAPLFDLEGDDPAPLPPLTRRTP